MKTLTIAGGIGKDAEIRETQNGKKVTGWSVGVKDGWGQNEKTLWFDCNWWGQRGEKVAGYIKKGGKITVTGDLSTREHNGKTYLTIDVNDVTLQGQAQGSNQGQQSSGYSQDQGNSGYGAGGQGGGYGGASVNIDDDEIPF